MRSIFVVSLLAVALAGCGRTLVRETVVERPVAPATVVAAGPAACSLGGINYSTGSLSCQAGEQYRCREGAWERVPGMYC